MPSDAQSNPLCQCIALHIHKILQLLLYGILEVGEVKLSHLSVPFHHRFKENELCSA